MSKAGLFGTTLLVAVVAYACSGGPDDRSEAEPASASTPGVVAPAQVTGAPATPAPAPVPAATVPAGAGSGYGVSPEVVTVSSVTDGDTFRVGDRRIRVIGIDSCEAGTTGGSAATAAARSHLSGATVTLTREPGVDLDRYGREVRYVQTTAGDLGTLMVPATHTGVYEGGNNASSSYLARLRSLDGGASACGTATTTAAPTTQQQAPRTAAPTTSAAPRPLVSEPAPAGAYYKNCSAARAAGAAPLYRGQAGYAAKLDRDGDGVACE